ncbi:24477_t:CDS:2 [Gigaspora margarita]|uniref:24477_t:CDS:1 n=1 Tax=Gigaspora margarita TaxID=4874 RepID=A0ABN7V529_GIGMA|nr:24477_t:CDS:2 [Gigaspora margarita]
MTENLINVLFEIQNYNMAENLDTSNQIDTSTQKFSSKPKSIVWGTYIKQGNQILKANLCKKTLPDIRNLFLEWLTAKVLDVSTSKKRKLSIQLNQSQLTDFIESTKLTPELIKDISRALLKAFVVCGIPFHIIENLFFIELLRTLRPAYEPPSKDENSVEGGGFKQWVDSYWHTIYDCVFSIIRHKVPLEIIRNNNPDVVNTSVLAILHARAFFDDLNALAFALHSIKLAISILESCDCLLADCFIGLVRLGAAIKRLPKNDYCNFCQQVIAIFNKRFAEFDDDAYILCFFLHPEFTTRGTFRCILLVADNFYAKMNKTSKEKKMLISQIRSYRFHATPFDILFALFFLLANSKKELPYFSVNKGIEDLYEALSNINLSNDDDYKEEEPTSKEVQEVEFPEEEFLKIEVLLNFDVAEFTNDLDKVILDTRLESSEEEDGNV